MTAQPKGPEGSPPVVELIDVARTYPGSPPVHALRPVTLTIRRGEFVTVVGPSGSGKSTLLNLVGMLDRPSQGTYLLDGLDVSSLRERQRTALRGTSIGFIFQAFHLLPHRSALENVMLALTYRGVRKRTRRVIAADALDHVGLAARRDALPTRMSGGERQRVAVARALVGEPSLLLCDEPTGNLDTENSQAIMSMFHELNARGHTVVVITHDADVARGGRRTVRIRDGLVQAGS